MVSYVPLCKGTDDWVQLLYMGLGGTRNYFRHNLMDQKRTHHSGLNRLTVIKIFSRAFILT